jgi:hypothetical protein
MSESVGSGVDVDDYQERYVAYLDLLGFRTLVERAERDRDERAKLREILGLMRDTLCESRPIDMHLTYFSDCVVLSAQRTGAGLSEIVKSIDLLTFNLLQYDVLVRGGLTAGIAHHSRDFVYGTPLIRAIDLEKEGHGPPMTLVAQEVLDDATAAGADFLPWLAEDTPGRYFVNYLRRFAEYRREPRLRGTVNMDDPGQRVVHFICHRLNTDTGSELSKARWLQAYWNRTVAKEGVFSAIEPGLGQQYVSSGPTIIRRRPVSGGT